MTSRPHPPARAMRENPDLDQLKRQARELLEAYRAGSTDAVLEVTAHHRTATPDSFALHDAQFVLARSYGFQSWPKLKAAVDGVTAARLHEAVERRDLETARALLHRRPEIVDLMLQGPSGFELRALHIAVMNRDAAMTRLLVEAGADTRVGIWPNRDATGPRTIARERGYDEIVALMDSVPATRTGRARREASRSDEPEATISDGDAVLETAVRLNQRDRLVQLLEQGFDPDERTQVGQWEDQTFSAGGPLLEAVNTGRIDLARILLEHGADPNANVFTSGSATYAAYRGGSPRLQEPDPAMIELMLAHGGWIDATSVGYLRQVDAARRMLSGELDARLPSGSSSPEDIAAEVLWSGASGRSVEIVRLALERLDWRADDPRWFWILWRPLPGHEDLDDTEQADCRETFRLILERCDPNLRTEKSGQTMLHEVVARDHHVGVALATLLLDAGARTDVRDSFLLSTPLGWACRWGRVGLVRLLLARGADPVERDAETWATPRAWADKMNRPEIRGLLDAARSG